MEAVKFSINPITVTDKRLSISLEKMNEVLAPYKLRVDALSDMYIDKDDSAINPGDVLKIQAVYINPADAFDDQIFFSGYRELEDKFEAIDIVYGAQFDEGDLLLTLILNGKNFELEKKLEAGGTVAYDAEAVVDKQMQDDAASVFQLVGIEPPASDAEALEKTPVVRQKAIEHYQRTHPKPVHVFFNGQKIDIGAGAGMNSVPLQTELAKRLYIIAGSRLQQPDVDFQTTWANNKAVMAIDILRGMALNSTDPIFRVTEDMLENVIEKVK